jgi:uncharacterized membrane protein
VTATASRRRAHLPAPSLRMALWATVGTLGAAALLELAFYGHGGHDALSDIPGRFYFWHVHPSWLPYENRPIEYPVVIGYVTWMTAWLGRGATDFFVANAVLSVALALAMTVILYARGSERIWRWAVGVPLALYAFHNWDLLAMVPALAGLLAFDRRRDRAAGALLAFGAFAKVFPALILPPLVVVRWRDGDRRGAARLVGGFLIVSLVLNGPIAAWDWGAWTFPASFQGGRSPTWGSLWHWLFELPGAPAVFAHNVKPIVDVLSVGSLVAALVVISVLAVRRHLSAFAIGAAVVGAFVLTNKVYSPNYDLWLLPFFVVVPLPRRIFIAFVASSFAIFVLVYGYLHGGWSISVVIAALPSLVVIRAITIVSLILTAVRERGSSVDAIDLRAEAQGKLTHTKANASPVTDGSH